MIQEDLCPDGANTIFRDTYVQAAIATVCHSEVQKVLTLMA